MKQTRKIFTLEGYTLEQEAKLAQQLKFKGVTCFHSKNLTLEDLLEVFKHNKSALCISCKLPGNFQGKAISCNNLRMMDENLAEEFQQFAEENNCDIGDHVTNTSSVNDEHNSHKSCAYCKILGSFLPNKQKILYASDNFFVVSTLGQFINGYLLIIPYSHVMSNAGMSKYKQNEFLTVLEDVSYILGLAYNKENFLVWENGSGLDGTTKSKDSVVHAHTHIVPSSMSFADIEEASGFPFKDLNYSNDLKKYKADSYLLIKGKSLTDWKICQEPGLYIPRQYVRQLLAEENNIPGNAWNWRTHPYYQNMKLTDLKFFEALIKNWSHLPQRIKNRTCHFLP